MGDFLFLLQVKGVVKNFQGIYLVQANGKGNFQKKIKIWVFIQVTVALIGSDAINVIKNIKVLENDGIVKVTNHNIVILQIEENFLKIVLVFEVIFNIINIIEVFINVLGKKWIKF